MLNFRIDKDACIQCGECAADCPAGIIAMQDYPEMTNEQACIRCQHCFAICPTGALSIFGMEPEAAAPEKNLPSPAQMSDLIKWRRSVRRYTDEDVSEKLMDELLEAACHAPTGVNAQDVLFTVVRNRAAMDELRRETLERLGVLADAQALPDGIISRYLGFAVKMWRAEGKDIIFRGAPHLLVTSTPQNVPCPVQDADIALATFELLASANGLGTVWDGMFIMALAVCPELKDVLKIPADHAIGYAMVFGHPAVQYHRPARRSPAKINFLG